MTTKNVKPQAGRALCLLRERSGNIMPMAAIGMVALAGMVGGGVDVSRAYMVQNRLQNACDAGVLAGRRSVSDSGYDAAARAQATSFFDTNFDETNEGVSGTSFTHTTPDNGSTIEGVASTTVDTAVMQLFGFRTIPLSVSCSASMSVGNSDVMMILDTTGSMGWNLPGSFPSQTRLEALQDAMKNFYDTVATASAGSNARVRYGFVPYSSSVNVGSLIHDLNPSYLADNVTVQSREPQYIEVEVEEFSGWEDPVHTSGTSTGPISSSGWSDFSGRYRNRAQCNNNRPSNTLWANNGSTTTSTSETINGAGQRVMTTTTVQPQQRTQYRCARKGRRNWWVQSRTQTREQQQHQYAISDPEFTTTTTTEFDRYLYKAVDFDTTTYKTFNSVSTVTGTNGSSVSSTWNGCIEERATVNSDTFSWSSVIGFTPSGVFDLDIDGAPDVGDPDTQWKPMWPEVAYYRTTDSSGFYLSSNSESDFGGKAGSYCPQTARLFSTMTEAQFDTYTDSLNASGATYHNLGMVWGARLSSPTGLWQSNVTSVPTNGGAVARHIIFMTDGEMSPTISSQTSYGIEFHDRRVTSDGFSDHAGRHSERFLAACEATKAKGVRVWVIAFASAMSANLEECSSDDSSFTAANAAQLNTAFQEIAKDVGELRITQ